MSNQGLVEKLIDKINTSNPVMGDWINEGLSQNGPWEYKQTQKAQVNCFMRYHLCQVHCDTSDVREYLSEDDDDDTWVNSVVDKVLPVLNEHKPF